MKKFKSISLIIVASLFLLLGFLAMADGAIVAGLILVAGLLPIYKLWKREGKKRVMLPLIAASFVIGMIVLGATIPTEDVTDVQAETASAENEVEQAPELTEEEKQKADAEAKRIAEEEAKAEAARIAEEEAKAKQEEEERKLREAEEAKEKEAAFANSTIEFKHLSKGADRYAGEAVRFKGEIVQIQEDEEGTTIRLAVTQTSYGWSPNDIIMLYYPELTDFFTDDVVTVDGYIIGDHTYTSQAGWDITVPLIGAETVY
ncbi:hypothetical protein EVJ20_07015 [Exiguobacterium sp. SH0S1]|uniref:hypothetical protein n=1 Tax=Exiguobacterium sp. SH0S1 TaxID=2510949 RepID=UPI00103B7DF0|nr:hypothetical protein [Exiguobacterium sp. SH0S1]TCI77705.1 hypothetical protein EVJ20_07015 [Exiguobacterium sp. SH0S1]